MYAKQFNKSLFSKDSESNTTKFKYYKFQMNKKKSSE